jgi:hypothetical protein
MHKCPICGGKLSWSFIFKIQKWAPTRGCPSCGQLLTHSGMLANGAVGGTLGASAYQILKLYIAPGVAFLVVMLSCLFFGYRAYSLLEIIPTDEAFGRKVKSSIELSPTAAKFTAYVGIVGGFILLVGCIFIVAILGIDSAVPLAAKALFSALALVGLGGLIISVRILRGKSLLSGYPLRKP